MAQFNRHTIDHRSFYTMSDGGTRCLLDFTAKLYGKNFKFPTFNAPRKSIKFLVRDLQDAFDSLFVTKTDIGVLLCTSVRRIYITKPIYYQILVLYEEHMAMQYNYDDEEVEDGTSLHCIDDIDLRLFKSKVVFVNLHEKIRLFNITIKTTSSGAGLGWINYEFTFDNGTTLLYLTSYSLEQKFYLPADPLCTDYLLINKNERELEYQDHQFNDDTIEIVNEIDVQREKTSSIDELIKKQRIEQIEMIEQKDFYNQDEPSQKQQNTKVEETVARKSSQLDEFNKFIKRALKRVNGSIFIQHDLTDSFIDVAMHVLSLIEQSSINLFIVSHAFDKIYAQLNNQSEWLREQCDSEPFPFKKYRFFKHIRNLNYAFTEKQKIIFVGKHEKIPEIFRTQQVACFNRPVGELDRKKCINFQIKMEATVNEIEDDYGKYKERKEVFVNAERVEIDTKITEIDLLVDEHTLLHGNSLYLHGILKITDFYKKNEIQHIVEQTEHWMTAIMSKNSHIVIGNSVIFPELGVRYEIQENGQIREINH
ncbi:hypothetical protein ECANGB1_1570 [Enterospora canceri]|uniref:Uncharacterized protein n=1 Tax=Enterospora canceri TaxID=1081671 RepID=A0A1Y1S6G9_9MICR|nr:hypothetical protein ECANGB1_1570 [Enterospora canceri]